MLEIARLRYVRSDDSRNKIGIRTHPRGTPTKLWLILLLARKVDAINSGANGTTDVLFRILSTLLGGPVSATQCAQIYGRLTAAQLAAYLPPGTTVSRLAPRRRYLSANRSNEERELMARHTMVNQILPI